MKKTLGIFLGILCLAAPPVFADFYSDVEQVRQFNPDGKKYEFVKDYLVSLSYLDVNAKRVEQLAALDFGTLEDAEKGRVLMESLIQDNVNLRVAKNMMKRYAASPNGLILKVTEMFTGTCDEQIALNTEERALDQTFYDAQTKKEMEKFDEDSFRQRREELAMQRRASLQNLFGTALMVQKILVSSRTDRFGELVRLGVTENQRGKLLRKIGELFPDLKDEKPEGGQSFIAASVAAVKERLLDQSWGSLKGNE